jgi:outer membrane protein assembly factor BamB
MAFVTTQYGGGDFCATKLDGHGDATNSVVWRYRKMVPSKPSPILVDDLIYLCNDSGVLSCVEAKTGNLVWQERIGGHFSASPIYVDGRIYVFSEEGKTTVFKPGRKYEPIGESQLSDGFMSSAAIAGKAFYLRTKSCLYRIED